MKKFKWMVVFTLILSIMIATPCLAAGPPKIVIDGNVVYSDVPPTIVNGTTMVPVRVIPEYFGWNVEWKDISQKVDPPLAIITFPIDPDIEIVFILDYHKASIDYWRDRHTESPDYETESYELAQPMTIINNRAMVPVRFFAEAFDMAINWDAQLNQVTVSTKQSYSSPGNDYQSIEDQWEDDLFSELEGYFGSLSGNSGSQSSSGYSYHYQAISGAKISDEYSWGCQYYPVCPYCGHQDKYTKNWTPLFWEGHDTDTGNSSVSCVSCGSRFEINIRGTRVAN